MQTYPLDAQSQCSANQQPKTIHKDLKEKYAQYLEEMS